MFVIIGTTTADLVIFSEEPWADLDGDGFRVSNLVFTDVPLTLLMGGNGGISAYALAGLGVPTALCGAVGRDPMGDILLNWLTERNVRLDGFTRSETYGTSTSTIIMSDVAHQAVFHHLGATQDVRLENMPEALLTEAKVLLATSFPIVPHMRSGGFAQALATTHQAGGLTALDIGPAIGHPVTLAELVPLLPFTDYLLGNTHELAVLTSTDDWESAAAQLVAAGARHVVIKQGAQGAAVRGGKTQIEVAGFAVEAKISVGAGDSFNVGFLYGLHQTWPLERAVRFGNAFAALVVAGERGVLDAPRLAEVEAFLRQQAN
jgi:sugar/nucleoside kinase (ribokinase family)